MAEPGGRQAIGPEMRPPRSPQKFRAHLAKQVPHKHHHENEVGAKRTDQHSGTNHSPQTLPMVECALGHFVDVRMRSPGSVYALVGLVFNDVTRFHRETGDLPKLRKYKFWYATRDEVGATVFQNIETGDGEDGRQYVRFWFGSYQGGIAFEYGSLEACRRGSRIVKKGKDFIYFDIVSKK